jgi:multidrug efflux pump subunit AcrB
MNMHERELKGLQSEGRSVLEYLKDNPEARLFKIMGKTENLIRKLKIRRDKLKDMGASSGQIRRIDDYMTARMKRVNDVVERVEK